ncbi:MAG: hypothetical protein ACXWUL_01740 [Caldimonas sp.]
MRIPAVIAVAVAAALVAGAALAKLPPLTDEAKAKALDTTAKAAWADKVGGYQLCQAMDRVAATYRARSLAAGKAASAPEQTPPCTDPGPYVPPQVTPTASKPLEASEAHSPPGMATGAPSTKATSAELTGTRK